MQEAKGLILVRSAHSVYGYLVGKLGVASLGCPELEPKALFSATSYCPTGEPGLVVKGWTP